MHRIKIEGREDAGIPSIDLDFGRVTVILGANGAGKSRLLRWIKDNAQQYFGVGRQVTYVEGGRVAQIPPNLYLDHQEVNSHRTAASSVQHHKNKRLQPLTTRIKDALITLSNKETEEKNVHSDRVTEWIEKGQNGDPPKRPEPPLQRLARLFNEALPLLTFTFENPNLKIKKGPHGYGADNLSDGERQTLALLADVGMLAEKNSLIVVDEPELNMSAQLASALWATIEAEYPEAVFVYATHSIPFTLRDSVDKIIVLSAKGLAAEISDPTSMDESELRPFLGAMPNILRSDRVLLVEGQKNSFDSDFYRWITGGSAIEIVPVGDCNSVEAASKQSGIWANTPKGPTIRGIIDRDYRSDDVLKIRTGSCDVLELHEAESYLCDPKLLHALAGKLLLIAPSPTEADFITAIVVFAKKRLVNIAAKRAANRLSVRLGPSLTNSAIDRITDETKVLELLQAEARAETARAGEFLKEGAVEKIYRQECANIGSAINEENVRALLRYCPGKELLIELGNIIGLKSTQMLATAVRGHLKANDFEYTKELQKSFPNGWI